MEPDPSDGDAVEPYVIEPERPRIPPLGDPPQEPGGRADVPVPGIRLRPAVPVTGLPGDDALGSGDGHGMQHEPRGGDGFDLHCGSLGRAPPPGNGFSVRPYPRDDVLAQRRSAAALLRLRDRAPPGSPETVANAVTGVHRGRPRERST